MPVGATFRFDRSQGHQVAIWHTPRVARRFRGIRRRQIASCKVTPGLLIHVIVTDMKPRIPQA